MARVLIAVDESDASLEAAKVAHRLFGDAEFFVVNVAELPVLSTMAWGTAYPIVMPMSYPPVLAGEVANGGEDPEHVAEQQAAEVAQSASLHAEAVGAEGDPATAIIRAAHEHHVDVIVVGSHQRSWLSRLFVGSVTSDVVREADIPVLVVK